MVVARAGHAVGMSENASEDAVAGEPGWTATEDEGGTVPEDDAQ